MMSINNRKRFISLLLAFSVMLSGLWVENVQADFLLEDGLTDDVYVDETEEQNPSTMEQFTGKFIAPETRTEQIQNRNVITITVKSTGKIRQTARNIAIQSLPAINKFERWRRLSYQRNDINDSNKATIHYIHRKDGKKRLCLYD